MDVSANVGRLGAAASAFISKPHKLLIDGKWVAAKSGKTFPVFDPATGGQIAAVADGGAADIDLAVKAARKAFDDGPWGKVKPTERGKIVWRLADLLARLETGIPLGRAGTPAEAAGAVYLFCLPEADYISGQTLMCTGGLTGI